MRKIIALSAGLALTAAVAFAQTSPNWTSGYVPTAGEWNALWASKQDYLGTPPLLLNGGTMTGKLVTAVPTTSQAGLGLPHGVAPTSPVNGDVWTTTSGLYVRINGATQGPVGKTLLATLTAATSASLADTTSLTSAYPRYELVFTALVPATNATTCRLRVNVAGVQTASYLSTMMTSGALTDSNTSYILCSGITAPTSNADPGIYGSFVIYRPSDTTAKKMVTGSGSYLSSVGGVIPFNTGGYYNGGNGAVTGLEVTMAAGNITSGTISIYGLN